VTLFTAPPTPQPVAQTHAIVIGVGAYPHLPGGAKEQTNPAPRTLGLGQLTSPPLSAMALTNWLLGSHHNPAAPLGSVELLLSPATYTPSALAAQRLGVPEAPMVVDEATHDKIKAAFALWYRRLNAREDNVGFFYFCGHGVEASDRYLLPADFGSNDLDWTEHIIDFTLTHNNMDRCRAGTQCFFLDCCRDRPLDLQSAAASGAVGRPLLGPQPGPIRDRDGQIYHAAAPGRPASGPANDKSYFARALLDCLNGMGAGLPDGSFAPVDCSTLGSALKELVSRLAEDVGAPGLRCDVGGDARLPQPVSIHLAQMPVDVLTIISCNPSSAQNVARLTLRDAAGNVIQRPTLDGKPWKLTVPAGEYAIEATFDPPSAFQNARIEELAAPPLFKPPVRIPASGGGPGGPTP
jgi:hypothetical protein